MRTSSRVLAVLTACCFALSSCGHTPATSSDSSNAEKTSPSTSTSAKDEPTTADDKGNEPSGSTGFGATKEAWLSAHEQAPGYTAGAAFLPLLQREGSSVPKYAAVSLETPVVMYTLNLADGTSLDDAKNLVLDEFPPGARFGVVDDDEATCLIATIKSPPVQRAMNKHGWRGMVPMAAFETSTATQTNLDPRNVTDVSMLPGTPSNDLGFC